MLRALRRMTQKLPQHSCRMLYCIGTSNQQPPNHPIPSNNNSHSHQQHQKTEYHNKQPNNKRGVINSNFTTGTESHRYHKDQSKRALRFLYEEKPLIVHHIQIQLHKQKNLNFKDKSEQKAFKIATLEIQSEFQPLLNNYFVQKQKLMNNQILEMKAPEKSENWLKDLMSNQEIVGKIKELSIKISQNIKKVEGGEASVKSVLFDTITTIRKDSLNDYCENWCAIRNQIADLVWEQFSTYKAQLINQIQKVNQQFKIYLEQKKQQQQQQKTDKKSEKNQAPHRPNISVPELSQLIQNIHLVPSTNFQPSLLLLEANISKINDVNILIFMANCLIHRPQLSWEFLSNFYNQISNRTFKYCFRYFQICFIELYSSCCLPLYGITNFGRFNVFLQEILHDFRNIRNITKLLAKEYQLGRTNSNRFMLNLYNRNIGEIETISIEKRFIPTQIMELYNIISPFYPVGLFLLKEAINWRDIRVDSSNLETIKSFIINYRNSIEPQYIYSVDQRVNNEINISIIVVMRKLILQVIKIEPIFVIQISPLLEYLADGFNNEESTVTTSINLALREVIDKNLAQISDPAIKDKFIKILAKFFYENAAIVNPDFVEELIDAELAKIMQYQSCQSIDIENWKHIYHICKLQQQFGNQSNLRPILTKFHIPFLKAQMQKSVMPLIKPNHPEYNHILSALALMPSEYWTSNPNQCTFLIKFINEKFLYQAKSVLGYRIFQLLILFQRINVGQSVKVDPEIYAYLWTNISAFIVYIRKRKRFYIKRGRSFSNDPKFLNMLVSLSRQCDHLKNLKNSDRLNIVGTLISLYWKRLNPKQIASLLIIFGNPTKLPSKMIEKLQENISFTTEDIEGLDLEILSKFKLQNKSLALALSKNADSQLKTSNKYVLSNALSEDQLKEMFSNEEFYEEALKNPAFTNEHLIPPPVTSNKKIKMIYNCLQIANKIRLNNDFLISSLIRNLDEEQQIQTKDPNGPEVRKQKRRSISSTDLDEEYRYAIENDLIKLNPLNDFKLDKIEIKGHNQLVEGWGTYEINNVEAIKEIYEFSMFRQSDDNLYEKVLLALKGNYGFIRNILKGEPFNSFVLQTLSEFNVQLETQGSLLEVSVQSDQKRSLQIFCSKPSTSKLHLIYAYVLSHIELNVCIVSETTTRDELLLLMNKFFNLKSTVSEEDIKVEESESDKFKDNRKNKERYSENEIDKDKSKDF